MKKSSRFLIPTAKYLRHILLSPVGSGSTKNPPDKERRFESPDKPVVCYEYLLLLIMLLMFGLARFISFWTCSSIIITIAIIMNSIFLAITLFHLLVPPRLSGIRCSHILICLIFFVIFLDPTICSH